MISRYMGVAEILIGIYMIYRIATHSVLQRDYMIFAVITLLFTFAMARTARERRERHGEISREKARSNYDRKRYEEMRREVEEMDEEEYETHPINVQEFAGKLYRGEASLSDIPDTRSRANREYEEGSTAKESDFN